MIYVCAMTRDLLGTVDEHHRLYAHPLPPEPAPKGGFVILDSGAYGLSMRGMRMDANYMHALAKHYAQYGATDCAPTVCIAPDEYLNPARTMRNYRWWNDQGYGKVAPVLQCTAKKKVDLFVLRQQIVFYRSFQPRFIAFSNPAMRGVEARMAGVQHVVGFVRRYVPGAWLHCLGAGWDVNDAAAWAGLGFNSIDSIAWYTAAQSGQAWGERANDWKTLAVHNARSVASI